ncbi:MAG: cyclase family protein [Actinomycetota bacterium]
MGGRTKAKTYASTETLEVFGRRMRVLDLGHELSDDIPVYPGHMKVATWWHLTHDESLMRMGDTDFWGYGVRGMSLCEHVSTHVDAIYHFNPTRPDLTIDAVPLSTMITPAAWVDLSFAAPRTDISLDQLRGALDEAAIKIEPGSTLLYYTGVESYWDTDAKKFLTDYPGMGAEASRWLLDQGIVNLCTDAISTDNPTNMSYPNHRAHGERLVVHTENVANMTKIPVHQGFWFMMLPLRFMGMTGSPIRPLALWNETSGTT